MKQLIWHLALLAGLAFGTESARAEFHEIPPDTTKTVPVPRPGSAGGFLTLCDGKHPLRIHLDNGGRFEGRLASLSADSVFLTLDTLAGPHLMGLPVAGILRIDEQRSGFETGFRIGGTTGAVLGGALGFLMGMALSGLGGADNSEAVGAGFGVAIGGAAVGGIGLGLTGGLIGSTTDSWYRVYSADEIPRSPTGPPADPRPTRGEFLFGRALTVGGDPDVSAWGGRFGLQQPLGGLEIGPELGYWNLGATQTISHGTTVTTTSGENLILMGLSGKWQRQRPGLAPFFSAGTGLYFWNDPFFAVSAGGGARWRSAKDLDIFVEARYHLPVAGGSPRRPAGFLTFGAGLSFDL